LNSVKAQRAPLRRAMRERRLALDAPTRIAAAQRLADHFQAAPEVFGQSGYVAGYWAMGGEIPLHVLQLRLHPGQAWCLPCIRDDGSLMFAPWRMGDPLVSNRFGIPEPDIAPTSMLAPADLSLVLMPLLAFDAAGNRLGTGGGFYDRSFAFRRDTAAPPRLVGVGYAFQQVPELGAEAWDVPLDSALTDDGALHFTR
jgi:5-formyltetrahydrofolate cyclo-ligase